MVICLLNLMPVHTNCPGMRIAETSLPCYRTSAKVQVISCAVVTVYTSKPSLKVTPASLASKELNRQPVSRFMVSKCSMHVWCCPLAIQNV